MRALLALAAAALRLALLASADEASAASGLCRERQEEPPPMALLQRHARRAPAPGPPPPAGGGGSGAGPPAMGEGPALAAAQAAANVSTRRFPDILPPGLLPLSVAAAMKVAEAQAFVASLQSLLDAIDLEAQEFLLRASQFQEVLLKNVSASGVHAVEALKALVLAQVGPVRWSFDAMVDQFNMFAPAAVAVVGVLGLDHLTTALQAAVESIQGLAQQIDATLSNASDIVSALANATEGQIYILQERLAQTAKAGIAIALTFETAFFKMVKDAIAAVADPLGISIGSNSTQETTSSLAKSMEALLQKVDAIANKILQASEKLFLGTSEAAKVAVDTMEHSKKSGSEGLRLSCGLLLLVMGLAIH